MRSLIKAAIRIIIILFFFKLLYWSINQIYFLIRTREYTDYYNVAVPFIIFIGLTVVGFIILFILWKKTDWLVKLVVGDLNENELVINTSNLDLIYSVLRIFGIFLLITALPELLGLAFYHVRLSIEYSEIHSDLQRLDITNKIIRSS